MERELIEERLSGLLGMINSEDPNDQLLFISMVEGTSWKKLKYHELRELVMALEDRKNKYEIYQSISGATWSFSSHHGYRTKAEFAEGEEMANLKINTAKQIDLLLNVMAEALRARVNQHGGYIPQLPKEAEVDKRQGWAYYRSPAYCLVSFFRDKRVNIHMFDRSRFDPPRRGRMQMPLPTNLQVIPNQYKTRNNGGGRRWR